MVRSYIRTFLLTSVLVDERLEQAALQDLGDFLLSAFSKFHHLVHLHLACQALDKFIFELGRYLVAGSEEGARNLILPVTCINVTAGDRRFGAIDHNLLRHFHFGAEAVLNPMAALSGGIVGQEVVKACNGKFHPRSQFFYFSFMASLSTEPNSPFDLLHFHTIRPLEKKSIPLLKDKIGWCTWDVKKLILGDEQITARMHRLDEVERFTNYKYGSALAPNSLPYNPTRPKCSTSGLLKSSMQ